MMDFHMQDSLDRWITGNYGDDDWSDDREGWDPPDDEPALFPEDK